MKTKKVIIPLAALALSLGSCKKSFFDINYNPNSPTESVVAPDLAIAPQMTSIAAINASTFDYLHRWLGYWSASGSYSPSSVEWSYNITNDFGSGLWTSTYYIVGQLRSIQAKSKALDWKFYEGMAKILEAHQMLTLVDAYGNAPYTEAFDLAKFIRPKYDNAEDIYKSIFALVDEGMTLVKASNGNERNLASRDIIFKGSATNWCKFGNTLKLKMLLHTVKASTFNASTEIGKITAEGSGFLGSGLGAVVQPGYTPDKPNPYYNAHFFSIANIENDNYNRANDFSLSLMKSMNDDRYKKVYRPTKNDATKWQGTIYGSAANDDFNSDKTSGPGRGITKDATVPMWILSSTEAMFLKAEAVLRGWIPGDAQTAYNDAVKESFVSLEVPNAITSAETYLQGVNPKVVWPASGTADEKMTVLMWQKYFGLNGIQANETWVDYRRLDLLTLPLSVYDQVGTRKIPVRLLYPTSEYSLNKENVEAQGTVDAQTTKLFWDK